MSTPTADPMIGRLIDGRYQVRSRIARGGMATVYLATDLRLERRVAIKIMHGHLADDTQFKNRFVQEARSAARLAHPNVVNVFDQGQDFDMAYLVMEYLPGITLRELLNDYKRLTPEQTLDIMEAVLGGLSAAHRAGIVHRDLKPENVLLADDGRIKIGDFGLARAASANTATGQALLGTIAYLSPELVTRGVADARSDIYALGIMMFEMLSGQQPFQGEQPMQIAYQHANDPVPLPSSINPAVPPQLDDIVLWATEKDPELRPHDAREMLDRLMEADRSIRGAGALPTMTTAQPTAVMAPSFTAMVGADGETAVLRPASKPLPVSSSLASPDVARLSHIASRRRARGLWLFVVVVLLATLAAGTGWYFGAGPGAPVTVPAVAGDSAATAAAAIRKVGLQAKPGSEYSLTVAQGSVTRTTPAAGASLAKGGVVTVISSLGPRPITLPPLAGASLKDVEHAVRAAGAKLARPYDYQFSSSPTDIVLSAATAQGANISTGGAYFEGQKVSLVVSLGAIPDVAGDTVAQATSALKAKGLLVTPGPQSYSNSVPNGSVISASPTQQGPVRKGSTIALETSRGPAPIAVPNVVGQTWDVAKPILTGAGFEVSYPKTIGIFPVDQFASGFVVTALSPSAGSMQQKGSTITVSLQANIP